MTDTTVRHAGLSRMLTEPEREMRDAVESRIQADAEVALLQMRAVTLVRLDEALARLDAAVRSLRRVRRRNL
jgi:hypothetical protein